MPQRNVEILTALFAAAEQGDFDTFMAGLDPEIEWDATRVFPDGEIVYGHEGIRQGWRRWRGAWQEDFEVHAEEFRELDPSTILVVVRDSGTAKSTGITLDRRIFQIWEMRDGLVIRTRHFLDPSDALEAVGLQG